MRIAFASILFFCYAFVFAQHETISIDSTNSEQVHLEAKLSPEHETEHAHHMIQLVIGHTQISEGRDEEGQKKWLTLPSWGLNYNYKFNESWQIGLHTDMIVEEFEVGHADDVIIVERTKPVAVALIGGYKTRSPFTFLLGGGVEFEKEEHLGFMRFGVESGWHFGKGQWEVSAVLEFDIKFNNYNSWIIGMGIARLF